MDINEIVHTDFDTDIATEIENLEEIIESLRNSDLSSEKAPYQMSKDAAQGIVSFVRVIKEITGSNFATDVFLGVELDAILNPKTDDGVVNG